MYSEEWVLDAINDPRWAEVGKVHDWRNHLSEDIKNNWNTFSSEQRRWLYNMADSLASGENWG